MKSQELLCMLINNGCIFYLLQLEPQWLIPLAKSTILLAIFFSLKEKKTKTNDCSWQVHNLASRENTPWMNNPDYNVYLTNDKGKSRNILKRNKYLQFPT